MSKYNFSIINISFLILLFSCQSHEKRSLSTYTIKVADFEESIPMEGSVEPVETTVLSCPRSSDGDVTYIIDDGALVNDGDVVCVIDDKRLLTRYNESLIKLEIANAELNKIKANLDFQYALLEAQVKNNTAQTQIANLDTLQLSFLSPKERRIKELELEKVAIEKKKLEKKLVSMTIINKSELRKSQFEIDQLTQTIKSSKEQLEGLTLKAPIKGIATRAMHYSGRPIRVGDNVWNNMPVVKIPNLGKVKVKLNASEGDYKRIDINDSVEYSFDANPGNKAWGKIAMKSPVGTPIKENSNVKYFEIEASVDSVITIPGPGLSANCKIYLKRVRKVIVVPQIAAFDQDGIKVVYVKHDDSYEMRQIAIGLSSPKIAIITAGLKVGEQIAFSKPTSDLVTKKTLFHKKKNPKLVKTKPSTKSIQ